MAYTVKRITVNTGAAVLLLEKNKHRTAYVIRNVHTSNNFFYGQFPGVTTITGQIIPPSGLEIAELPHGYDTHMEVWGTASGDGTPITIREDFVEVFNDNTQTDVGEPAYMKEQAYLNRATGKLQTVQPMGA